MTKLSSISSQYGVYSYKSDLIKFNADDHQNWKHRQLAMLDDHLANSYICKLDEEIFTYRPIIEPDIFNVTSDASSAELETDLVEEQEEQESDISFEWDLEKWDDFLINIFDIARVHSYCVVQLYNKAPWWRVFYERDIKKMIYDSNDQPIGCNVQWSKKLPKSDLPWRNHEENLNFYRDDGKNNDNSALFISFGVAHGDDLGSFDLQPLWDLLIDLRWIRYDITCNSGKTSGFYHYLFGDGGSEEEEQAVVDQGAIVSSRSGIGAKERVLKAITPLAPAKPEFSIDAMNEMLNLFAGAARVPIQFLKGERDSGPGFSGTAGELDEDLVIKKKKYIFSQFERDLKKLIEMRWGVIIDSILPYIPLEVAYNENKDRVDSQMDLLGGIEEPADVNKEDSKEVNQNG